MPEPVVVQIVREFREDLAAREASQFAAMASAWKDVEGALEDRMFSLAAQIADEGDVPSLGQLGRMERYTELLRQLRIETQRYGKTLVPTIEGEQFAYGQAGIDSAVQAIDAVGGPSIVGSFNVLPISAVENMVGLAGDGSPLSKLLDETWPDGAASMTQALIRSTALGVNPRVTARQMAKATEASLDRMMVIARTEQLRVFREASRQSYEASGVVSGYRRICAKQTRTCVACLMADGAFYPLSESLHEHPQGRCALIPWVEGANNKDWPTGQDWFLKQDAATQQGMLGKPRYDAWQAGAFRLEDIPRSVPNDTWGPSLQPRSLKALLAGERFERGTRPEATPAASKRERKASLPPKQPQEIVTELRGKMKRAGDEAIALETKRQKLYSQVNDARTREDRAKDKRDKLPRGPEWDRANEKFEKLSAAGDLLADKWRVVREKSDAKNDEAKAARAKVVDALMVPGMNPLDLLPTLRQHRDLITNEAPGSRYATERLLDLDNVPPLIFRRVVDAGLKGIYVSDQPVPKIDDMKYLAGQHPRGWGAASTWDEVSGCYTPKKKYVIIGGGKGIPDTLALHEFGHAAGDVLAYDFDSRLIAAHKAAFPMLGNPYMKQEGAGGEAGRQESFAECFALTIQDRPRALKEFGPDLVAFVNAIIKETV